MEYVQPELLRKKGTDSGALIAEHISDPVVLAMLDVTHKQFERLFLSARPDADKFEYMTSVAEGMASRSQGNVRRAVEAEAVSLREMMAGVAPAVPTDRVPVPDTPSRSDVSPPQNAVHTLPVAPPTPTAPLPTVTNSVQQEAPQPVPAPDAAAVAPLTQAAQDANTPAVAAVMPSATGRTQTNTAVPPAAAEQALPARPGFWSRMRDRFRRRPEAPVTPTTETTISRNPVAAASTAKTAKSSTVMLPAFRRPKAPRRNKNSAISYFMDLKRKMAGLGTPKAKDDAAKVPIATDKTQEAEKAANKDAESAGVEKKGKSKTTQAA